MARRISYPFCAITALISMLGCGSSHAPRALPSPAEAESSLPALREEILAHPHDPDLNFELGAALYSIGQMNEALPYVQRAFDGDPSNTQAVLMLGRIHEESGHLAAAEALLLRAKPASKVEKEVIEGARGRVNRLRDKERASELLAGERDMDMRNMPENTMAVYEFQAEPAAWELRSMGKALSAVLITDLSRLQNLRLVERRKLQVLIDEIGRQGSTAPVGSTMPEPPPRAGGKSSIDKFAAADQLVGVQQRLSILKSSSNLPFYEGPINGEFDEPTKRAIRGFQEAEGMRADGVPGPATQKAIDRAARSAAGEQDPSLGTSPSKYVKTVTGKGEERRTGRLLGARRLMTGTYDSPAGNRLALRARILDSVDGSLLADLETEHPLKEFYRASGEIVVKTADALEIPLSGDERRKILSMPPPTRNLAAFLAFGRGLDLEDQGLLEDANLAYAEAVRLDPRFDMARERVQVTRLGSASFQQALNRSIRAVVRSRSQSSGRGAMARAMGTVGMGIEEGGVSEEDPSKRDVQADGPPLGTVRVTGQIPVPEGK